MTPPPDVRKEFGAAIRQQRLRLGLSQEALGERAELHRTYITDVERGARNLSLESIAKLARALQVSIGALFPQPSGPVAARPGSSPTNSPAVDLLLVEDDPLDLQLTLEAFAQAKLANRVQVVRDGAAALDFLFCRGEHAHRPAGSALPIVLLDLYLPKVHGLEVLGRIRADERTRPAHVIVLTGSRSDAHLREALRLGADAYIVKPVDFHSFSAVTPQLNFSWRLLKPGSHA
ncbi:MAG TPA: response regulator [Candidatus Binatia bacterium]|jgi:CheY-like chemotaxis protein/DNA-binding XRE family transcriptional regulator|nr:response regulator [Candidatus Binatia bacterium]